MIWKRGTLALHPDCHHAGKRSFIFRGADLMYSHRLAPVLVMPPAELPVSLEEMKAHLNIDFSDKDATIRSQIAAATAYLDAYNGILGQALISQTWKQSYGAFPSGSFCHDHNGLTQGVLRLPLHPIISITSIKSTDTSGVEQTLDPAQYQLLEDVLGFFVAPASSGFTGWPSTQWQPDAVRATFVAGYGAAAAVPETIKQIIRMLVANWFENREAVAVGSSSSAPSILPYGAEDLIRSQRRIFC